MELKDLKKVKRALIIIDMVTGFTRKGNMANPYMESIIAENVRLVKMFLENNDLVIATKEAHNAKSVEFNDYPAHCLVGTDEYDLVDELKVFESEFVLFNKNSTCIAVAPDYVDFMKQLDNLEEVVFTGGCRDICLMQAVIPTKCLFNELDRNVKVIVPENATDTYDAPNHKRDEWNDMSNRFMAQAGIQIVKKYERGM